VHELVNGQQLHGRDAERRQVLERGRMSEPRIRATYRCWYPGVPFGESLQMHLVHDRLVQFPAQRAVAFPVERVVHDDRFRHERTTIRIVSHLIIAAEWVGKDRGVPVDVAGDRTRIGINQELCRIAPMSLRRVPRAVHPEPVSLTGLDPAEISVPAVRCALR